MKDLEGVVDVLFLKLGRSNGEVQSDRHHPEDGRETDRMDDDIVHQGLGLPRPPVNDFECPDAQQQPDRRYGDENDQRQRRTRDYVIDHRILP